MLSCFICRLQAAFPLQQRACLLRRKRMFGEMVISPLRIFGGVAVQTRVGTKHISIGCCLVSEAQQKRAGRRGGASDGKAWSKPGGAEFARVASERTGAGIGAGPTSRRRRRRAQGAGRRVAGRWRAGGAATSWIRRPVPLPHPAPEPGTCGRRHVPPDRHPR